MIQVEHLTQRYGALLAIDDLSVTVEPCRVTGLLGPNGSGKTTTMSAILGLQTPTSGSALWPDSLTPHSTGHSNKWAPSSIPMPCTRHEPHEPFDLDRAEQQDLQEAR